VANALAMLAGQCKSSETRWEDAPGVLLIFSETIIPLLCLANKVSLYSKKTITQIIKK
jgi:hypothetical protein